MKLTGRAGESTLDIEVTRDGGVFTVEVNGKRREVDVHVTASNCVQCGAITAKGGRLTLPEGGDGPLYQET